MGELRVLDKKLGDLKVIWDPNIPEEVDAAREQFEKLVGKTTTIKGTKYKYGAYEVDANHGKGKKVTKFDPGATKVIIAPDPVRG